MVMHVVLISPLPMMSSLGGRTGARICVGPMVDLL